MLESIGSPEIPVHSDVPLIEVSVAGLKACALRADHTVACADANSIGAAPVLVPVGIAAAAKRLGAVRHVR
jgi:hypothetical protein